MTPAQKHFVGALIGLARVTDGNPHLLSLQVREVLRSGLVLCRREPDTCDRLTAGPVNFAKNSVCNFRLFLL